MDSGGSLQCWSFTTVEAIPPRRNRSQSAPNRISSCTAELVFFSDFLGQDASASILHELDQRLVVASPPLLEILAWIESRQRAVLFCFSDESRKMALAGLQEVSVVQILCGIQTTSQCFADYALVPNPQ